MDTSNGNVSELWQEKFKIVKNGLDRDEVFSFIGNLIDQNEELAKKLEHIDSLTKLAERTVIEADKHAESIEIETKEEANARAASIIYEAHTKAKTDSETIIAEAEQSKAESERLISEAEEKAKADSETIIADAEEKAEAIKSSAEQEADRLIAEAIQKAQDSTEATTAKAEEEALRIRREAKLLLEKFKKAYEGFLSDLKSIEGTPAISIAEESEAPVHPSFPFKPAKNRSIPSVFLANTKQAVSLFRPNKAKHWQ